MSTSTPTRPVASAPASPPPPTPTPPRRSLGTVTVGLVVVAIGTIDLLATLGVEVPLGVVGPIVLVVLGLGVVVSALRGESAGGALGLAIALGVVLTLGSLVGSVLDVPLRGAIGERHHRPTTAAEVEPAYRVLMGTLTLDLREVDLPAGTTEVDLTTVLGEVRVTR